MRLLLLFLIVLSLSLSSNIKGALAASVTDLYSKGKTPANYDDVWERIRLGSKITWSNSTQIPPKQTDNNFINTHSKPYASTFREDLPSENPQPAPKYKIQPHTAVAPLHNYTELGFRVKFGDNPPPTNSDNCKPPVPTPAQQEHKSKKNRPDKPPHYRDDLMSAVNNMAQTEPKKVHLVQATGNSTPCPTTPLRRDAAEPNNTKKTIINERINKQITFFSENPDYLYRVAERARPYLYHIVEELSHNQLPLDLALLPIVESAYQPKALSPKGAAGLWQFIASTGKDYDLKQSNQYDERLDVLASTQAAIRFLSDLNDHFNGDWLLALAAYNCGQGAVDNAISHNLTDKLSTDYWSLRLPEETQDYVPRLLALSKIFANPETYGLKFPTIKNEPYFVKVKIERESDIKYLTNKKIAVLARLVNMSHEQFVHLNPGYLNPTLPTGRGYTFLLPHTNAGQLHKLLISIAQFMAEPVSQSMKATSKANSPSMGDLNESMLTAIRL